MEGIVTEYSVKNNCSAMKSNHEKMVQEVVKTINWNRIKYFHQVFGIKWQFEEKEGHIVERFPTISELKEELKSLLRFAIEKNTRTLDYGNWLIFWTDEEAAEREGLTSARLEAIFSLEETFVIDSNSDEDAVKVLESKLEDAVKKEKYEEAAKIRDKINERKNQNK
jgi:excinuclease UvrABC nuclease subunit